jgi:hypothetical protein
MTILSSKFSENSETVDAFRHQMTVSKSYSYIDFNCNFTVITKIHSVKRVRDNTQYSFFQSYVIADLSLHVTLRHAFVVNR